MKENEILLSENFHIQPENQFFFECNSIKKELSEKSFNIYKYKFEAADAKLRFATFAYEEIRRIADELEVGEFIYFDDYNRLRMSFYLEAFLHLILLFGIFAFVLTLLFVAPTAPSYPVAWYYR